MGHTVDLPESLYRKVAEYAERRHEEPGAVIVSWVMDAMHRAESQIAVANDVAPDERMNQLAGIINVPDADAGDYHDLYFSSWITTMPQLEIVHVTPDLDTAAWDLLKHRDDKEWSLVDAASFTVMSNSGMTEALTTDHHFTQAGFLRLLTR